MFARVEQNQVLTSEGRHINPKKSQVHMPCSRVVSLHTFAALIGTIAQVVEQWTENPCVPGSNPGGTTLDKWTARSPLVLFKALLNYDLS